jgi:hypothetical protein
LYVGLLCLAGGVGSLQAQVGNGTLPGPESLPVTNGAPLFNGTPVLPNRGPVVGQPVPGGQPVVAGQPAYTGQPLTAAEVEVGPAGYANGSCASAACGHGCKGHGGCLSWLTSWIPWWANTDNCSTIPRYAQPAPAGTYVNAWRHLQTVKAEMDDFVIYRHMWYRGGNELGPMGRYYLDLISNRMLRQPFPIVIETTQDDRVDEERRDVIISLLERRGLTDPSRVIVGYPIAEGMWAEMAPRIAAQYINPGFGMGGIGGMGGFGGFGGFGGGGFGGGGFGGFGF